MEIHFPLLAEALTFSMEEECPERLLIIVFKPAVPSLSPLAGSLPGKQSYYFGTLPIKKLRYSSNRARVQVHAVGHGRQWTLDGEQTGQMEGRVDGFLLAGGGILLLSRSPP